MDEEKKKENPVPGDAGDGTAEAPGQEAAGEAAEAPGAEEAPGTADETSDPKAKGFFGKGKKEPKKDQGQLLAEAADKYLRLAAEYDNYRKRTAKEKENAWSEAKAQTVAAFLPVYDNLERALKQETADEAYKKGVEMTMNQLKEVFAKLGVTEIDAQGKPFDPNLHNAVMHIEDENLGENIVAQVFQAGFMLGEKVIRFAMVQVAN